MCKKIMLGLVASVSLSILFSGMAVAEDISNAEGVVKPTIVNSANAKPTMCPGDG